MYINFLEAAFLNIEDSQLSMDAAWITHLIAMKKALNVKIIVEAKIVFLSGLEAADTIKHMLKKLRSYQSRLRDKLGSVRDSQDVVINMRRT